MKQLIQNLKTGETLLEEIPVPKPGRGQLLIQTTRSLVSLGTERMLVEFGKANLFRKARQQPDKVRQVLDKIRSDGLMPTVEAVFKRLDEPLPLGYCNVGRVTGVGRQEERNIRRAEDEKIRRAEDEKIRRSEDQKIRSSEDQKTIKSEDQKSRGLEYQDELLTSQFPSFSTSVSPSFSTSQLPSFSTSKFKIGDRVASNGKHAEYVCVPENLCARVPDNVTDEEASFTVIGAIALQGVRLCNPAFGETIVVIGLGLIGLLTAQFLMANGCRVVGVDISPDKLALAEKWGVIPVNPKESDPVAAVMQQTQDIGADGVIITASAKGDDIISQAARMSRKRGRIILVGVVGLNLNRADFYEKELTFQVSCSYGPGRYDDNYEQKGIDYPIGFVRWTEQRNFEAVLHAISTGKLDVKSLITERVPLENFQEIYGNMGKSGSIASILVYPENHGRSEHPNPERTLKIAERDFKGVKATIGIIGAGNFTKMTVLPALKKSGAPISFISSANGLSGTHLAKKYGIAKSTTDYREMLNDPGVGLVMITTRHDLHAPMVMECLKAGKHVFVEKPLCLSLDELEEIKKVLSFKFYVLSEEEERQGSVDLKLGTSNLEPVLIVGFNRRFSPHIQAIKKALGENPGPMNLTATMNAGAIPSNVWVHDMEIGGGRIIGEACHYLDLLSYLAASPIKAVCMNALGPNPEVNTDNASILLRFANGSNGVVNYFANGNKGYSKERLEIFSRGRTVVMDNFRRTEAFGFSGFKGLKTKIDKGHAAQFRLLTERLADGGEALIPFADIENVTKASFACIRSMMEGGWVGV